MDSDADADADPRPHRRRAVDSRPPERTGFDLEWLADDGADSATLTVFSPERERLMTEWLTVDRSLAVPVDELR